MVPPGILTARACITFPHRQNLQGSILSACRDALVQSLINPNISAFALQQKIVLTQPFPR
jgi:hypothetical protein